jgi:hypothetical protein
MIALIEVRALQTAACIIACATLQIVPAFRRLNSQSRDILALTLASVAAHESRPDGKVNLHQ